MILLDASEERKKESKEVDKTRRPNGPVSIASKILRIKIASFFSKKNINENRDLLIQSLFNADRDQLYSNKAEQLRKMETVKSSISVKNMFSI